MVFNLIVILGLLLIFFFLLLAVAAGVGYFIYANRRKKSEPEVKAQGEMPAQD
jgi:hypothetical protein